jgi:membrane fusion protein, multidrug efflux system
MVEMPRHEGFGESTKSLKTPGPLPPKAIGPRRRLRRTLLGLVACCGAVGGSYFGYDYWTNGRFLESTDDAYIKADYTSVAPKVAGYISEVLVEDNQDVKAGQILARIDDRDYRAALDQANADLNAAIALVSNLDAQITLQRSLIDQAKAAMEAGGRHRPTCPADGGSPRYLDGATCTRSGRLCCRAEKDRGADDCTPAGAGTT